MSCSFAQEAIDKAKASPFRAFVGSVTGGAGLGAVVSTFLSCVFAVCVCESVCVCVCCL